MITDNDNQDRVIYRNVKLKDVPVFLKKYEEFLERLDEHLAIEGKPLGTANREQASWFSYYDARRVEVKAILGCVEAELLRIRSRLYRTFTEGYQVDLGEQGKTKYIEGQDAYLARKAIVLEAQELYDKYVSAVDSFVQRGYALRNITSLVVASLQDMEL